jgi:hypothetical protein
MFTGQPEAVSQRAKHSNCCNRSACLHSDATIGNRIEGRTPGFALYKHSLKLSSALLVDLLGGYRGAAADTKPIFLAKAHEKYSTVVLGADVGGGGLSERSTTNRWSGGSCTARGDGRTRDHSPNCRPPGIYWANCSRGVGGGTSSSKWLTTAKSTRKSPEPVGDWQWVDWQWVDWQWVDWQWVDWDARRKRRCSV